jgi:hypothetical protein
MLRMSQRHGLALLFALIALALAGIAVAAAGAGRWPLTVAGMALAVWMASLSARALRPPAARK